MEEWKFLYDRKDFQISNTGFIRSLDREVSVYRNGVHYKAWREGRILAQRCSKKNSHIFTTIQYKDKNGNIIQKTYYLHRAVADHFIEKSEDIIKAEKEGKTIYASHIVKDYSNNDYTNIKWITASENISMRHNNKKD